MQSPFWLYFLRHHRGEDTCFIDWSANMLWALEHARRQDVTLRARRREARIFLRHAMEALDRVLAAVLHQNPWMVEP